MNVSKVLNSPKFKKPFTIYRVLGNWQSGRWVEEPEQAINVIGVVTSAGSDDLEVIPEAERTTEVKCFHTKEQVYLTRRESGDIQSGSTDTIEWNNRRYRLVKVVDWSHFGYYKSIGVSLEV